jgi:hypothetical protein
MIDEKTEVPNSTTVTTLAQLVEAYKTDKVSTFHKLRYNTRTNQASILRRMVAAKGNVELSAIKRRDLVEWHMEWSAGEKLSMGHAFIAALRTVCGFGASMLELEQCERISMVLHRMKFPHAPARIVHLNADQAAAICTAAREHFGWYSLALAQAFQFECMFRQRDCIGEWVPDAEPGESDVHYQGQKWLRGIRWEEINDKWILTHKTSKKQKDIQWNLAAAPMVLAELAVMVELPVDQLSRHLFPASGPIVINDVNGLPWSATEYRRKWRKVANHVGVPKEVRSMDSRAGAITEATEAGADIEHVKHAATHSDISQTQRYSRGAADKIAGVQKKRNEFRFRRNG